MKSSKKINKEERIKELLNRGVVEVVEREHLENALESGKRLRVKLGIDPTGQKIHLGRAVALRRLRAFKIWGTRWCW
jgi:tyrosyl-tRNA synthetase